MAARRAREGWWPGPESNQRHPHFQCGALPTELPGQACKVGAVLLDLRPAEPRKYNTRLRSTSVPTRGTSFAPAQGCLASPPLAHPRVLSVVRPGSSGRARPSRCVCGAASAADSNGRRSRLKSSRTTAPTPIATPSASRASQRNAWRNPPTHRRAQNCSDRWFHDRARLLARPACLSLPSLDVGTDAARQSRSVIATSACRTVVRRRP
jgi:hypothetical protein